MADGDRVHFTIYLLKGGTSLCWEGAELGVNLVTLTWLDIKRVFYDKYFTSDVRSRLKREFMTLRHGDSSVAKFVQNFYWGCHFMPLIANDAAEKLRHFIDGLRPTIRRDVILTDPTNYTTAVAKNFRAKQSLKDIDWEMKCKRNCSQQASQHIKKPYMGPPKRPRQPKPQGQLSKENFPKIIEKPQCKECNRHHYDAAQNNQMPHIISCMRAKNLIKKGVPKFLSIISAPDTDSRSIEDVEVVKDFPDVFPDDLSCIPPETEVEFAIELMPNTVPISKGAPVLFVKKKDGNIRLEKEAFMGHIVSKEGIEVDLSKVELVKQWPMPKSVTEIRSFLDLACYYRKFIMGFSSIVVPLTSLKNVKFAWGPEYQRIFDQAK
ncbi:uncharacterized protein LOC142550102 [Primulina tabacum]|uniref:uncharacterized protein LOC142550102 n=1 Tax=Primulina tabacum TaxID=48773 RepID=UPI003F5A4EB4